MRIKSNVEASNKENFFIDEKLNMLIKT